MPRPPNPDSTANAFKRYSLATLLCAGILLASTGTCADATAEAAEAALGDAEVAVAKARVRGALWSTAWSALLEARRTRISQDYAASARWSTRAVELAGLGITQAEQEARSPQGGRAGNTGGNP